MTHNHQKNGFSKILGVIFVVVVLGAIISGAYYWLETHQQISFDFLSHKPAPVSTTTDYINYQYDFGVTYKKTYQLDITGAQQDYFKTDGSVVADISIPPSEFPQTNFGSAHAAFGVKNQTTLADCQTYVISANKTKKMTASVALPAGKFYTDEFKQGAAGTTYDTKLYRILENQICYEASLTVGIANIGNFTAGTVTEVNQPQVWDDLTAILNTFKFIADNSATSDNSALTGTVQGHVSIGASTAAPDAYDGVQIIVYTSDRGTIVQKINIDSSGNYIATIPGGDYYITYSSIYDLSQPPMKKITITPATTTTQNFSISSGN